MDNNNWKTKDQLARLTGVHRNTVTRWLTDKQSDITEGNYFERDYAKKTGGRWLINPEKFFTNYPQKVFIDDDKPQTHPDSQSYQSSHEDKAKGTTAAAPGTQFDQDQMVAAGLVVKKGAQDITKKAQEQVDVTLDKLDKLIHKPFYHRTSFWLSISIVIVMAGSVCIGFYAYDQHKKIIVQRGLELQKHFNEIQNLQENSHKNELLNKDNLFQKDLEFKESQLKSVIKQLVDKEKDHERRLQDKNIHTEFQKSLIKKYEQQLSEVKTELIQFKNRSGQALNTMNVKKEEI